MATDEREVFRLGDLSPKRKRVEVERDGQTVELWGYVEGARCPGTVVADVDAARDEYLAAIGYQAGDDGSDLGTVKRDSPGAYTTYIRKYLMAVIPSLEGGEADVFSSDREKHIELLTWLGWFKQPPTAGEDGNADENPPSKPTPISSSSSRTSSRDSRASGQASG